MLTRSIFAGFSIVAGLAGGGCAGQGMVALSAYSDYTAPIRIGSIETGEVTESSGLSASECKDVLWTHNDAGNEAFIFAMDLRGKHLGTWKVEGARNVDWESIATTKDPSGKCFILIGDIGDNDESRTHLEIYRVPEPQISNETARSNITDPISTGQAEVMRFSYADRSHNAETLLVQPKTGDIYVVTKEKSGPASVHRIKAAFGSAETVSTEKIGDVSVPSTPVGLLTGGSFSPDGRRLMLCDKKGGYEFAISAEVSDHEAIWKQKPSIVDIGDRKQGEGVSYGRDGLTLYASSEKKNAPLFMIKRK